MKKLFILILFIAFFLTPLFGQENSTYLSAAFGAKFGGGYYYHRTSEKPFSLNLNAGAGIPLIGNLSLYSRISYSENSHILGFDYITYSSDNFRLLNELEAADLSLSQLILNTGLQFRFKVLQDFMLGLAGGVTYSYLNHEARLSTGDLLQKIENEGVFGYFVGACIEKPIKGTHFAIFGEVLYNSIRTDAVYFKKIFSGTDFTIGARYYFQPNKIGEI